MRLPVGGTESEVAGDLLHCKDDHFSTHRAKLMAITREKARRMCHLVRWSLRVYV